MTQETLKLYTRPEIYLVGNNVANNEEVGRFLASHAIVDVKPSDGEEGEQLVELAGRLCYMSFANPRSGGTQAYIQNLLASGHGSVLEHAVFSMIFCGVSRNLTHELVRHRAGMSYSQLSQRFVDHRSAGFVVPPRLLGPGRDAEYNAWLVGVERLWHAYHEILDVAEREEIQQDTPRTLARKRAREAARTVLPGCTETKIFVTGNARAWRHFLELRGSAEADAEIRRLAFAVLARLQSSPGKLLFADYEGCGARDGTPFIYTEHRKV